MRNRKTQTVEVDARHAAVLARGQRAAAAAALVWAGGQPAHQVLRHHQPEDARLAVEAGAWALGMILWPGSRAPATPRPRGSPRAAPQGRDRRRVRQPAARRGHRRSRTGSGCRLVQLHGDEGPGVLRRGRPPDRREGDQGRADPRRLRRAGDGGVPHRLPPARHAPRRPARRHGRDVRLGARARCGARRSR